MLNRICLAVLLLFTSFHTLAEDPLPAFNLVDFHTKQSIESNEFANKVLYIDFWASWCKPCRKTFPFMNSLLQKYSAEEFAIIAINMDEFPEDAERFLKQYPADFSIYTNPDNPLAKTLGIPGLPMAFVVDKQGNIRARHAGYNENAKQKTLSQLDYLVAQP